MPLRGREPPTMLVAVDEQRMSSDAEGRVADVRVEVGVLGPVAAYLDELAAAVG
ncbi:hypothetical protein GCM10010389_60690 [Streptomyces echinoruber]|uniref:Uncharacterized protein n=1 Tax=Streptomyces echinoruber TaxID=68898 RepID=A0A918VQ80_9ACTN|nr:hypothetical protein GCM10010389_60690 [Streptomyces echinoruber]